VLIYRGDEDSGDAEEGEQDQNRDYPPRIVVVTEAP
jgi:hypothetical protein